MNGVIATSVDTMEHSRLPKTSTNGTVRTPPVALLKEPAHSCPSNAAITPGSSGALKSSGTVVLPFKPPSFFA